MKLLLDANVVIHALEVGSPQHRLALRIVKQAPIDGYETHVSELLYLELLSKPGLHDQQVAHLYTTASNNLSVNWPITSAVLLKAAELRRHHASLKTPDAIHLATSLLRKCDYFVTDDKQLLDLILAGLPIISIRQAANL